MINNLSKKIQTINRNKKEKLVEKIFSDIPKNYDLMTDIMSLGLHRIWKEEFIKLADFKESDLVLDIAAGSGDITKEISQLNGNIETSKMIKLGHDFNMLILASINE